MGNNNSDLWPAREAELKALCADDSLTYRDIGKLMGITADQAQARARKLGFREARVGKVRAQQRAKARTEARACQPRRANRKDEHGWPWTDELVEQLKALLRENHSNAEIAEHMGFGLTAGSVSKKLSRLKLSYLRVRPQKPARPIAVEASRARHNISPFRLTDRQRSVAPPEPLPPERPHLGEVVPLERLGPTSCRFPIGTPGEPGFGFCGCQKFVGGPYCPTHARVCFTGLPVKPKRAQVDPSDRRRAVERFA